MHIFREKPRRIVNLLKEYIFRGNVIQNF